MQAYRRHKETQTKIHMGRRWTKKRGRIKWQWWSGGEENKRQMANNVMREIRVCDGYLVCWLLRRPPRQRRQKSFLLPLGHLCWFSLEEERVVQQSSVSISLSFWEPRYQSSRRRHASRPVPTKTNKNLTTNAIKGLSIPQRSLTRVRSDRYDKIIFLVFLW